MVGGGRGRVSLLAYGLPKLAANQGDRSARRRRYGVHDLRRAPDEIRQPVGLRFDAHCRDPVLRQVEAAGEVSVGATPVDDIVMELGLVPADLAVLHIDVQGAERLVLAGATVLVRHVALVSIEVNFAELYRGGAQIEEIEEWLGGRGFRRIALSCASHPTWGDALYLRETS